MASPSADENLDLLEGVVLRIKRLSIHDGEGLRTVVFLKGCPLRCTWCSTPESQDPDPQRGYIRSRCTGCGLCVAHCPEGALALLKDRVETDIEKCRGCLACADVCQNDAVVRFGEKMTVSELVKEICKDEVFYFHSAGGVTISGGEGLLQPEFVAAVLRKCRSRGIDTAIETCLHAPWSAVEKVIPHINTLYVDLKHTDDPAHNEATGVGTDLILRNLSKLDGSPFPIAISVRLPLIPGLNDSEANLLNVLKIASSLKKVREIEILPYHRLGNGTYEQLGRRYALADTPVPTPKHIARTVDFLEKQHSKVHIKVGGGYQN